jgi:hypothetical protein
MLVQAAYFVNFFMFKVARARSHCAGGGEMLLKGNVTGRGADASREKYTHQHCIGEFIAILRKLLANFCECYGFL